MPVPAPATEAVTARHYQELLGAPCRDYASGLLV